MWAPLETKVAVVLLLLTKAMSSRSIVACDVRLPRWTTQTGSDPPFVAKRVFTRVQTIGSNSVPAFSSFPYRYRNLVERFFNKVKHFRAVATRYDKNPA